MKRLPRYLGRRQVNVDEARKYSQDVHSVTHAPLASPGKLAPRPKSTAQSSDGEGLGNEGDDDNDGPGDDGGDDD
ncbi:hypothetical protein OS493_026420 [Desmophyllum pertusum]|uniref:Uncharacterized protein n=1 Tax=Desmophyllum pertusum TaxID=174260 RepID=A0A9X0CW86_9CNID|nr:hypothetical protein OS493_026420 [Desmophyllum pertusum]